MAHPNEDVVREGFAALGRGDMEALRKQFFADDVRNTGAQPPGGSPGHEPNPLKSLVLATAPRANAVIRDYGQHIVSIF